MKPDEKLSKAATITEFTQPRTVRNEAEFVANPKPI